MRAGRSASARPSVGMGGSRYISTGPARSTIEPRGIARRVPLMVTGTTARPDSNASRKPPFLSGWSEPSRVRVPSGKRKAETPPPRSRAARRRLSIDSAVEPRLMGCAPSAACASRGRGCGRLRAWRRCATARAGSRALRGCPSSSGASRGRRKIRPRAGAPRRGRERRAAPSALSSGSRCSRTSAGACPAGRIMSSQRQRPHQHRVERDERPRNGRVNVVDEGGPRSEVACAARQRPRSGLLPFLLST
jgi:hypothetical protein